MGEIFVARVLFVSLKHSWIPAHPTRLSCFGFVCFDLSSRISQSSPVHGRIQPLVRKSNAPAFWPGDRQVPAGGEGDSRGGAGGGDAVAALGLVDAALELSPRMEAALELRARALLALRRYREVAEMLHDYIPSCGKACSGDDTSSSSSSAAASLLSSGSGDLGTISRAKLLSPDRHRSDDAEPDARPVRSFRCFDISELKRRVLAGLSKNPNTDTQWRYETLDI